MQTAQKLVYVKPQGNFLSVMKGKCPRCGQGNFFTSANPYAWGSMLKTNAECSHCHLDFEPELGFYWGATYVSYALTVAVSVATFVISTLIFGFMNSLNLTYLAVNAAVLVVVSPLSFRFSRIMWLWFFYDREAA